ncbi:apolipoprotein d [Plakobranchus ocellatus]|uniref:Apolipoprotein d n=1 Tax=Plakobranchus ocellatus TaxID=259542 RepID=A0AAV4C9N4_9GAST|nr:apolipoprotein d [Plakobranchus ocellatus]
MLVAAWAFIFITSFTLETASAKGPVVKMAKCPNVRGVSDDANRWYLGTWYEYKRLPSSFELGQQCSKQVFEEDGFGLKISIEGYRRINLFGKTCIIDKHVNNGNATATDVRKLSEFDADFKLDYEFTNVKPNYFIMDTNFDDWIVVFWCHEFSNFHMQFAWILTRSRGVPPKNLDEIERGLATAGIDVTFFHLPKPNPNPNSGPKRNFNPDPNPNSNSNPNPYPITNPNPHNNPNRNPHPHPNPDPNLNPTPTLNLILIHTLSQILMEP